MVRRFVSVIAAVVLIGSVGIAAAAAQAQSPKPDLSGVTLELSDLPGGFRLVPDDQLVDVGGSAKQIGENLERTLDQARLERYLVYASDSGDELIEVLLVGPLTTLERTGLTRELANPTAAAQSLSPSFTLFVDQSDPQLFDTGGVGDASLGYAINSTVTSSTARVTNVLGVPWTQATTRLVFGVRGDYILVLANQHVGAGDPSVDLLAAARHVDAHLASALGLPSPGAFRPAGTFSPEITTHIPTAGEVSTDPPVVFANLVFAALAVLLLTVAMRILNTTLATHEGSLEQLIRPARFVGRCWTAADSALGRRAGRLAGLVRILGVFLFYGVLFSLLEDGWRPWTVSGLFLLFAMSFAFGVVGTSDDMVELNSAHRWGLPARLAVKPALVLVAIGSVTVTKIAGLVPGLFIGTPEAFSLEDEVDERNEWRLAKVGLMTISAIGFGAWLLATPLDSALDGRSGFTQDVLAGLTTLAVLVFAVAVENLFANLLAFPGSEGATLRTHNKVVWWICMIGVTGLFFHTLVNPDGNLADSMHSTNVRVVVGTVLVFLSFTLAVYAWFGNRDFKRGAAAAPLPEPTQKTPTPADEDHRVGASSGARNSP